MCRCYNPLVVVRSPTGPQHPHHQLSWMTPMNGKSIGSWTVGSIVGTKDRACFTWSSGKDLTTPPMRQVGSHLNTWRMHPMWLEHPTGLIHISQPPKFIKRGHCFILLQILSCTDWIFCLNIHLEISNFHLQVLFYLQVGTLPVHPLGHLPHHGLDFRFPNRHFPHGPLLPKHGRCHYPGGPPQVLRHSRGAPREDQPAPIKVHFPGRIYQRCQKQTMRSPPTHTVQCPDRVPTNTGDEVPGQMARSCLKMGLDGQEVVCDSAGDGSLHKEKEARGVGEWVGQP